MSAAISAEGWAGFARVHTGAREAVALIVSDREALADGIAPLEAGETAYALTVADVVETLEAQTGETYLTASSLTYGDAADMLTVDADRYAEHDAATAALEAAGLCRASDVLESLATALDAGPLTAAAVWEALAPIVGNAECVAAGVTW